MMMLMILNWIPAMPMMPSIHTQLMNMGMKETSVSSILPYISNKTKNTSKEVINAIFEKSELIISTKRRARYCLSSTVTCAEFSKASYTCCFLSGKAFTSVTTVVLPGFSVI